MNPVQQPSERVRIEKVAHDHVGAAPRFLRRSPEECTLANVGPFPNDRAAQKAACARDSHGWTRRRHHDFGYPVH